MVIGWLVASDVGQVPVVDPVWLTTRNRSASGVNGLDCGWEVLWDEFVNRLYLFIVHCVYADGKDNGAEQSHELTV